LCFCFTQASDEVPRLEHQLTAERAAHTTATAAVADLQAQLRREQEESERWRHAAIDHESAARRAADDVSRLQALTEELKARTADAEAAAKKSAEEHAAAAAAAKAAATRDQDALAEARAALAEETAKGAR